MLSALRLVFGQQQVERRKCAALKRKGEGGYSHFDAGRPCRQMSAGTETKGVFHGRHLIGFIILRHENDGLGEAGLAQRRDLLRKVIIQAAGAKDNEINIGNGALSEQIAEARERGRRNWRIGVRKGNRHALAGQLAVIDPGYADMSRHHLVQIKVRFGSRDVRPFQRVAASSAVAITGAPCDAVEPGQCSIDVSLYDYRELVVRSTNAIVKS